MSGHGHVPDDNNAAIDAFQPMAIVALFAVAVLAGLVTFGKVPLFGIEAGGGHHDEAAGDQAEADH